MANKNIKINLDYSQFTGGITECQRKMSVLNEEFKLQQATLGNNASEVDKLTLSQSKLVQQANLQNQMVEKAREKFEALSNAEGATASQIDNAHKAYIKQLTALTNTVNELEKVNNKLEETASEEAQAAQNANQMASNIATAVTVCSGFVAVITQVKDAIVEAARASSEWADELATTANQIGTSTETLQEWAYAANFTDTSISTMESSLSKLTRQMGEAQNGSTSAQQAFQNLGVSVTNADGTLRSAESVFYDVIDALGDIPNKAEQDAAAMNIFGKSAQELAGVIDAGSEGLRSYAQEAQNLGLVLNGDQINALNEMQDAFDQFDSVMQASSNRIQAGFAPAITIATNALSNMSPAMVDVINITGNAFKVFGSMVPTLSNLATATNTLRIAKTATAVATGFEATSEISLGMAAQFANLSLGPQVMIIGALALAAVGLVEVIKALIEAYVEYKVRADAAADSTKKFADAASGQESTDGQKTSSGTKHFALGGRVANGGQVWVGEQGAELVNLPTGSTVYNHQESRNMSTNTNVFNVTIDAKNVNDFNKVVNVFNGLSQSMNRGGKVNG